MSEGPVNSPEIRRLARVLEPGYSYASVTDKIASIVLTRPVSMGWLAGFTISFTILMVLLGSIAWLIIKGVGIWGINIPIGWGFAIVNFVWWIGIGHAGTLISAILFLLNQQWRTSINRFAEAMTLFAVACAGIFPGIHVGRPWMAFYMFPYPSTMGMWPQFRSPRKLFQVCWQRAGAVQPVTGTAINLRIFCSRVSPRRSFSPSIPS